MKLCVCMITVNVKKVYSQASVNIVTYIHYLLIAIISIEKSEDMES
jgi:hypothetical protein